MECINVERKLQATQRGKATDSVLLDVAPSPKRPRLRRYREKQLSGFVSWKTCLVEASAAEVDPDGSHRERLRAVHGDGIAGAEEVRGEAGGVGWSRACLLICYVFGCRFDSFGSRACNH